MILSSLSVRLFIEIPRSEFDRAGGFARSLARGEEDEGGEGERERRFRGEKMIARAATVLIPRLGFTFEILVMEGMMLQRKHTRAREGSEAKMVTGRENCGMSRG